MQRPLATAVLLLASCGRLQFDGNVTDRSDAGGGGTSDGRGSDGGIDARPCSPVGHDEDGDNVDDACDACPQRVDDQTDTDGDGIGDACDLAATQQTRTLFDPFVAMTASWNYYAATVTDDVLRMDSLVGGAGADLLHTPGRDTYEISGVIVDNAAGSRQVSLSLSEVSGARYYCELYDSGSFHQLNLTYTPDGIGYTTLGQQNLPTRLVPGAFRLILDHTPPATTCIADWDGVRYTASGDNPAVTPTLVGVSVFQLSADVGSFVQLSTP